MTKNDPQPEAEETPIAMASGVPVWCRHDALMPVGKLIPNPRNPNEHADAQVELLAKIIGAQGWRAPVVISRRSGMIVAGHCRRLAALAAGLEDVPVEFQDFASDAEEWAHLLADNRIAELAENDAAMLKDLLGEIDTGEIDMDLTGYDEETLEALMTASHQDPKVKDLDRPPPKMAWVLLGVELGRFHEINAFAEAAAKIPDAIVIVAANDAT